MRQESYPIARSSVEASRLFDRIRIFFGDKFVLRAEGMDFRCVRSQMRIAYDAFARLAVPRFVACCGDRQSNNLLQAHETQSSKSNGIDKRISYTAAEAALRACDRCLRRPDRPLLFKGRFVGVFRAHHSLLRDTICFSLAAANSCPIARSLRRRYEDIGKVATNSDSEKRTHRLRRSLLTPHETHAITLCDDASRIAQHISPSLIKAIQSAMKFQWKND